MPRSAALAAALTLGLTVSAFSGCQGRPRLDTSEAKGEPEAKADGHLAEFDLGSGLPETSESDGLFETNSGKTLSALVLAVARAKKDEDAKGLFLRLGTTHFNWAQSEELGQLFAGVRQAGKPVYCHAHSFNSSLLWFASVACDRVFLSPAGDVDSVGIAAQAIYLKRLLERFNVQADFLHMGKYKSAAEMLTREGPSDEAREALLHVLGSMRKSWLDSIVKARANDSLASKVEDGPWGAEKALELGMIDAVSYLSVAREELKKKTGASTFRPGLEVDDTSRPKQVARLIQALAGTSEDDTREPRIVILPTAGSIAMQASGPLSSGGIAAVPLSQTLRRLREANSVKAVVLRIDSPGGSALASDLLWHELMQLKEKKTLIISVGDLAASGGYYMACAGDAIVASRTSIVGSIGVVGGKIVIGQALTNYGADTVTISPAGTDEARARAAYLSALTPWDEPTKVRVSDQMRSIYELFLRRVAEGRKLPIEEVRKLAEGRIWSGEQGVALKLVDEIGGLSRAIDLAREKAKLPEGVRVDVESGADSLLEMLLLDADAEEEDVNAAISRFWASRVDFLRWLDPNTRRYVTSLGPLLDGERVLTALPFALAFE